MAVLWFAWVGKKQTHEECDRLAAAQCSRNNQRVAELTDHERPLANSRPPLGKGDTLEGSITTFPTFSIALSRYVLKNHIIKYSLILRLSPVRNKSAPDVH